MMSMMTSDTIWTCEQWFAGKVQETSRFNTEAEARSFAKKLSGVAPGLVLKIEEMPIQHVWN